LHEQCALLSTGGALAAHTVGDPDDRACSRVSGCEKQVVRESTAWLAESIHATNVRRGHETSRRVLGGLKAHSLDGGHHEKQHQQTPDVYQWQRHQAKLPVADVPAVLFEMHLHVRTQCAY